MQKYEKLEKIGEGNDLVLYSYILVHLDYQSLELNYSFGIFYFKIIGTYGTVFKAKNRENQEIVALKRVRLVSIIKQHILLLN